jgi:phytol kinase
MVDRLIPDPATWLTVAPTGLLIALGAAGLVAWLHARRGVRTTDTRKIFHVIIITAAAGVHLVWGPSGVVVYGTVVTVGVLYAVARGRGFPFHDALARPAEASHGSLYVLVPLVTTALGGVLTIVLFPSWAHVGYLAVAWGDAAGELVGTRWGRHRYRVPSLGGSATRSLEGSAAVAVATTLAAFIAIVVVGVPVASAFTAALIIGVACAIVEAVSHHGVDNLTLQVAAAGLAAWLVGG